MFNPVYAIHIFPAYKYTSYAALNVSEAERRKYLWCECKSWMPTVHSEMCVCVEQPVQRDAKDGSLCWYEERTPASSLNKDVHTGNSAITQDTLGKPSYLHVHVMRAI